MNENGRYQITNQGISDHMFVMDTVTGEVKIFSQESLFVYVYKNTFQSQ